MREFVGSVILESLSDESVLCGLSMLTERVVDMPHDPDAAVWHVRWYCLPEPELLAHLPRLARAMRRNWYAHFWAGDDLCVILPGRVFWVSVSDRSTWMDMLAYGDTAGVERTWTESIPTAIPDYVREALDRPVQPGRE